VADRRDGFTFGVPPGWRVRRSPAGRGTFAVLAFRSARTRANRYAPELAELVRSLRTLA
jgi:hypothetical protein